MCIPNGWKTIEQAAAQIGISTQEVHRWALNISLNGDYTPSGLPPKEEKTEIVVKGIDIVRSIDGQLIINDKAVEGWMQAQQHALNLQAKGWVTLQESAKIIGVSEEELQYRIEQFASQAEELGITHVELLERMGVQIFLSHANEDKARVLEVYQYLQSEGFQPWLDEKDLQPGQLWDQEISKAIRTSDFILIFFSKNSITKRGYIQRELKLALYTWEDIPEGMIHTIPVRLDNCTIPNQFSKFQHVDLFDLHGFTNLVHAIKMGLSQRRRSDIGEL